MNESDFARLLSQSEGRIITAILSIIIIQTLIMFNYLSKNP